MSQDPQRPNSGPPDLDEILQRWLDKIKQLFTGEPASGKNNQAPSPFQLGSDGNMGKRVAIILLVVIAIWLASGFYLVDTREEAVVMRFGRYTETTTSGPNWRFPWPIGSHEIVKLSEIRSIEIGFRGDTRGRVLNESLMLTQDQNIVDMQLEVQYDVKDARDFVFNNASADGDSRDLVKQIAETAIREVIGKNNVDFVLNEGRGQVNAEATRLIQTLLDNYRTGVRISKVNISDIQPPEAVLGAFADAVKAGQDKVTQTNEGVAYSNDVVPKARGLAASLLLEAEGYKQSVIARAEGDVARFNQIVVEYARAPQVTRDRLYLDTMQQVLNNSSKVLVDGGGKGSGNLLYLPLDKLLQLGASGAGAAPGSTNVSPPAVYEAPPPATSSNPASSRMPAAVFDEREGR